MMDFMLKGGWVMYAILGASVLALTIIIERLIFFARAGGSGIALMRSVERDIADGKSDMALEECEAERGIVARIVAAALREWKGGPARMEEVVNFEGNRAVEAMERNLRGLAVITQGAPLLGLLGTVTGLIRAFMSVERLGGEANVSSLAGGIWEALLTTAFGLIVAIPAMFAYHFFETKVERYARLIRDVGEKLASLRRAGDR